jgi:AraC-like DNA-binding protein
VRASTLSDRHRLYLLARVVVARHYRRPLTLAVVASALSSSPRQLQRAIPVRDVARLVGYRQAPHFAGAFRRRYGLSPARFREQAPRREYNLKSVA